jgi:hypothetical protein
MHGSMNGKFKLNDKLRICSFLSDEKRWSLVRSLAVTAVRIQDNHFLRCGAVLFGTCLFKYMVLRVGDHSLKSKKVASYVSHVCVSVICYQPLDRCQIRDSLAYTKVVGPARFSAILIHKSTLVS